MIEVLSPTTAERDRVVKRAIHDRHGVLEYRIADPEARAIEVLIRGDGGLQLRQTHRPGTTLTPNLLPDFHLPAAGLFADIAT